MLGRRRPTPAELEEAVKRLYMGPSRFLFAFTENPRQALADFKANPAKSGALRDYLGRITLENNLARVAYLAKTLAKL